MNKKEGNSSILLYLAIGLMIGYTASASISISSDQVNTIIRTLSETAYYISYGVVVFPIILVINAFLIVMAPEEDIVHRQKLRVTLCANLVGLICCMVLYFLVH